MHENVWYYGNDNMFLLDGLFLEKYRYAHSKKVKKSEKTNQIERIRKSFWKHFL